MTTGNQTPERTIGQLVSDVTTDMSTIVRSEIELAKTEVTEGVTKLGKGIVFFAIAGVLALYMLGLLLLAGAWGIEAAGLPMWAGLLIVSGVLLLIIGGLGLAGYLQVNKAQPKPVKAINNAEQTVNSLKAAVKPQDKGTTAA
ncbi:phage holin family protein [Ornithinimicrobium faecis]|uniref:Phage holin family protein n=1 Tax=Ornithinimicrobium faecis TaxID=2934158 RepID=A0ABY4YSB3_9MICO|nr:phage holin family protein [Ornithinimicrobium sp. HY1793]USQ79636.1 phage holin family protein [Ornithinimicrobium sp. HY1793]